MICELFVCSPGGTHFNFQAREPPALTVVLSLS